MKSRMSALALALGSLVSLCSMPAFGMVAGEVKVKVPFEFRVGSVQLPAGRYLIVSADDYFPNLLEIRNEKGSPSVLVITDPLSPTHAGSDKTELVFTKVGKQEYLSQIWENDMHDGNQIEEPILNSPQTAAARQSTHK